VVNSGGEKVRFSITCEARLEIYVGELPVSGDETEDED